MSHREQEMTRRFLKHFFSILDAREQAAVGDSESERKDAAREESGTPLQVEQRAAIGNVLPQWVRLLCVQPHEQQQTPTANNNSNGAAAATAAGCESASYIEGDLGERWFALPHLALLPSPWTPRRPPPPNAARHRLLRHLQQRYESGEVRQSGSSRAFVDEFLCALRQRSSSDGRALEPAACVGAVVALLRPSRAEEQQQQQPPPELLAEVLFSEWCAAAGGDASFASTRVPLDVVAADLAEYCNSDPATTAQQQQQEEKGTTAVIGTLAGLACAYPMSAAPQAGGEKKPATVRSHRHRRNGGSSSDEDEDEEDMDDDNEYDSYSDTVAEARRLHRRIPTNNNGNYRRQLAAFLARNTSAFHVPLASLVLNVFHVTADADMGTAVEERCVTSARVEAYCRRGELQWFTVGESKRHRSLLESK